MLSMGTDPRWACVLVIDADRWRQASHTSYLFGKLATAHLHVDTYSCVVHASARPGQAFKDTAFVLLFNNLRNAGDLEADNAPACTPEAFKDWSLTFDIHPPLTSPIAHRDRLLWDEPIRP